MLQVDRCIALALRTAGDKCRPFLLCYLRGATVLALTGLIELIRKCPLFSQSEQGFIHALLPRVIEMNLLPGDIVFQVLTGTQRH